MEARKTAEKYHACLNERDKSRPPGAAFGRLIRDGLAQVYLDPLDREELVLLGRDHALREVADVRNWWRDENDQSAEPAAFILTVSITDKGRKRLASAAHSGSSFRPWRRSSG
jgi:hypothetical protein